jgi:TolB-like protein
MADKKAALTGSVFISYASQDTATADKVRSALENADFSCWIAPRDVRAGASYGAAIIEAINECWMLVLVLTRSAIDSPHVLREIERASSKKREILAIRLDATPLPADLEYFLSAKHWLDATETPLESVLPALIESLRVRKLTTPDKESESAALAPASEASPNNRHRAVLWALIAAAVMVLGMLAYRFGIAPRVVDQENVAPPVPSAPPVVPVASLAFSEKSIAVLPFVDMSEKKDQEFFSDGLAEELIDLLTKVPDLRVPARTSSFYFKGQHATIAEIARALSVAHILEGSVRRAGNKMRVTVQLIRADNGYHLWSETYDRDLKDVFKVQDDIAREVVEKLKVTLVKNSPVAAVRVVSPEVHNLYLQGRYYLAYETGANLEKAVVSFQHAVELDPNFAPAWGELGFAYFRQVANGYIEVTQGLEKVKIDSQKAIELDPTLADPYLVLAMQQMSAAHDWAAARQAIDKALKLDPTNERALFFDAFLTRTVGGADEAIAKFKVVLDRDPLNLLNRRYVARVMYYAGRLAEAEATIRQVLDMGPTFPAARYELGRILLAGGKTAAATAEFEAETSSAWRQFGLPLGYHAQGKTAEANQALATLLTRSDGSEFQIAETFAYFGDADKAFVWLDRAIDHDPGIQWVRGDPLMKSIVADPRFADLLRRLNLRP